jgi:hypothetical protein
MEVALMDERAFASDRTFSRVRNVGLLRLEIQPLLFDTLSDGWDVYLKDGKARVRGESNWYPEDARYDFQEQTKYNMNYFSITYDVERLLKSSNLNPDSVGRVYVVGNTKNAKPASLAGRVHWYEMLCQVFA